MNSKTTNQHKTSKPPELKHNNNEITKITTTHNITPQQKQKQTNKTNNKQNKTLNIYNTRTKHKYEKRTNKTKRK